MTLSEVPTDRLVKKSLISANNQTLNIIGIDTYFEPIVSVLKTSVPANLTFNLLKIATATEHIT